MRTEDILLIVFVLIAIGLVIWYLFGQSPTLDQITLGLMLANLGFTFKIWGDFQKHVGEHKGSDKSG